MPNGYATIRMGDALARHYAAHGLPHDGGENAAWFRVKLGPFKVPLPNPPARRRAVFWHDMNHVLTGYNTEFSDGEVVIAGFEVGAGCGASAMAWFINLVMMTFGLLVRPRAVYRAFVRGRQSESIYRRSEPRAALLNMTVGEVTVLVELADPNVRSTAGDRAAFVAWSLFALLVTLTVGAAVIGAIWIVLRALRAAM